jgi:hypothetical protein
MKSKNLPVRNLLFIFLFLRLTSCAIEEAQPHAENQLTVAQNFMTNAQKQVLFKMAKRRNLNLTIIELNPQQIRKALQKQPWEPGFDVVILDGLQAQKALTGIDFQFHQANFAAIPIGVSYVPDSVVKVRHFRDLSRHYLWSAADYMSLSIIEQSANYHNAQQFKRYLTFMRDNNAAFREVFGIAAKQDIKIQPTASWLLQNLEK